MQVIVPRSGQSFQGEPGAILDGSQPLARFRRVDGLWVASGQPVPLEARGVCLPGRPCRARAALFRDGIPLRQVARAEEMGPDTFLFDPVAATVALGQDPAGHVIETARAAFAFSGTASDVRIGDLVIEKYNSLAQHGAIQAAAGRGWQVARTELRYNSGAGIVLGPDGRLSESAVHHNGQLGVGGTGAGFAVLDNRIWANNTRGYDPDWEAGGLKVIRARDVAIRGNRVFDNDGPGLWCDIDCAGVTFERNVVERNRGPGIFFEISRGALIRDNRLIRNGVGPVKWVWGAEIQVAASAEVEVVGNDITVAPDGHGIILVDQGRRTPRGDAFYETRDNSVHDNRIAYDAHGASGGTSDVPDGQPQAEIIENGHNRFDRNRYQHRLGIEPLFLWRGLMTFMAFRQAGQEAQGSLIPVAAEAGGR